MQQVSMRERVSELRRPGNRQCCLELGCVCCRRGSFRQFWSGLVGKHPGSGANKPSGSTTYLLGYLGPHVNSSKLTMKGDNNGTCLLDLKG